MFHRARIHHLVVPRQIRLGNQKSGLTHAGNLVQAAGAAAANDQVTDGIDIRNVVKVILTVIEGIQEGLFPVGQGFFQALLGIGRSVIPIRFGEPGAMDKEQPVPMRNEMGQSVHQCPIDGAGSLRAAKDKNHLALWRHPKRKVGQGFFPGFQGNRVANRVTHQHAISGKEREGLRKGKEHAVHPSPEKYVQLTGNTILLVEKNLRRRNA